MTLVAAETHMPTAAPTVVPRGNSAQVHATADSYWIQIWQCPAPLPVNDSGIGNGLCGAMASYAEGFGGKRYPSAALAERALSSQTAAALSSASAVPAGSPPGVHWSQDNWTIVINGVPPTLQEAVKIVAPLVAHTPLPPAQGLIEIQAAADGLHTETAWIEGSDLYFTSATHNPAHALTMIASWRSFRPPARHTVSHPATNSTTDEG